MVILIFFELGYGIRFVVDKFYPGKETGFASLIEQDIVAIFEGASLLALMLYHMKNFKPNRSVNINTTQSTFPTDDTKDETFVDLMMITADIQDNVDEEHSSAESEDSLFSRQTEARATRRITVDLDDPQLRHSSSFVDNPNTADYSLMQ